MQKRCTGGVQTRMMALTTTLGTVRPKQISRLVPAKSDRTPASSTIVIVNSPRENLHSVDTKYKKPKSVSIAPTLPYIVADALFLMTKLLNALGINDAVILEATLVNSSKTLESCVVQSRSNNEAEDNLAQNRLDYLDEQNQKNQNLQNWAAVKQDFLEAFVSSKSFATSWCADCQAPLLQCYISCDNCRMKRCEKCDQAFHKCHPFHLHTFYEKEISRILLPEQFILSGQVVACDVPVPCFPVMFSCQTRDCLTAFSLAAGKRRVVIITERVCYMWRKKGCQRGGLCRVWLVANVSKKRLIFCI
ncbi:hypothetical protein OUZ56_006269 [Daphnia magna]|uniref:CxC3 like cysteine cluster domain-containing protein n=1 Tax=Daphnia magna TaxID=35525 RepID=A0ABQ9YV52_9CRUS|nr:hypothetical protein OUZ56_006269 [Daphnia magna]